MQRPWASLQIALCGPRSSNQRRGWRADASPCGCATRRTGATHRRARKLLHVDAHRGAAPCSIVHFVEWDELAAKKLAVSEFDIPADARMLTAYVHCSLHGVVQGVTFGADEEDVVAPPPPQPPQPSSGPSQYATFEFRPHTTPASTPHSHTFLSRVVEDQLPEWCARAGLDGVHCGMCR